MLKREIHYDFPLNTDLTHDKSILKVAQNESLFEARVDVVGLLNSGAIDDNCESIQISDHSHETEFFKCDLAKAKKQRVLPTGIEKDHTIYAGMKPEDDFDDFE